MMMPGVRTCQRKENRYFELERSNDTQKRYELLRLIQGVEIGDLTL